MSWAVLGLGTNLGARRAILEGAIALLGSDARLTVRARSALYATPPLGPPQPDYLNAAVRVDYEGDASSLLALAHEVEAQLGRERRVRWGPRTLDVDILWWGAGPVRAPALVVPHPELLRRSFALAPLLDVAPELPLHEQLTALGGAPTLASPGWSHPVGARAAVCEEWLHDDAELAAQLVALLVSRADPSGESGVRLTTRAFTGPAALLEGEDGASWLEAVARRAWQDGFAVRGCAVLGMDGTGTRGVLIGAPAVSEQGPDATPARLQRGARGARWRAD